VVEVTDEDDAPAAVDDPRNYDLEDEDGQMSSPEPSIVADPRNYDPGWNLRQSLSPWNSKCRLLG
jgi:hypothetical protein